MEDNKPQIITYNRIDNEERVKKDIANAVTMISYIVDQGIDIDENFLKVVFESRNMFNDNRWTCDCEINFYMTYKELTKLIKPVTVDSLTASRPSTLEKVGTIGKFFGRKIKGSLSHRSTTGYTIATIFCMFLLLFVQIYFYLGSTRLNNIAECEKESEEVQKRLTEVGIIMTYDGENLQYARENENLLTKLDEIDARKKTNTDLLDPWIRKIRTVILTRTMETDTMPQVNENSSSNSISYLSNIDKVNTAIIQEAKSYVLILGIYVLPLLYGIIGGFTFVLRELTSEIKSLTFSSASNIKYILRIVLGAIAGLSIGLFWSDIEKAQDFGISSFSPMLLAFLGGYCVEYLLQFFERITGSFFKKHADNYENKPIEHNTEEKNNSTASDKSPQKEKNTEKK